MAIRIQVVDERVFGQFIINPTHLHLCKTVNKASWRPKYFRFFIVLLSDLLLFTISRCLKVVIKPNTV